MARLLVARYETGIAQDLPMDSFRRIARDMRVSKSAMNSAWRRAVAQALEAGVMLEGEQFGMHGLKHRGITDTEGNADDKQQASGHKTRQMVEHYDHSVATVDVAGKRVKNPPK
jgi:integrase